MSDFYNKLNEMQHPDPKKHQTISFIKSFVRLAGYVLLPFITIDVSFIWAAASVLIASELFISEVIGIVEELV
jgi:hypothetical protein